MTLSLQANRSNWMAVQQSLKWILPMYQEPTHNLFLTQLWHRGQPNHILPADPRLHRPDQQVRHVLPPATSRQRLDVRRCESQPATWLWEDQGIQSHNTCWGEFLKSKSLSVFLPPHLICLQFPEQWSSTACQRSHHLHRAGGRQRRDSPLHRERARDCDGGRAGWDPSHQVGLLFQMVAIEGGGLTRWQCRIVSHSSSLSTLKKATHPTCCLSPHLHYNHHRLGHRHRHSPLWHILSFPL